MVDCRNCIHCDWKTNEDGKMIYICWLFEMMINKNEIRTGDCECYVDMDRDLP